jgi:hypothetical protein
MKNTKTTIVEIEQAIENAFYSLYGQPDSKDRIKNIAKIFHITMFHILNKKPKKSV